MNTLLNAGLRCKLRIGSAVPCRIPEKACSSKLGFRAAFFSNVTSSEVQRFGRHRAVTRVGLRLRLLPKRYGGIGSCLERQHMCMHEKLLIGLGIGAIASGLGSTTMLAWRLLG